MTAIRLVLALGAFFAIAGAAQATTAVPHLPNLTYPGDWNEPVTKDRANSLFVTTNN